MSPVRRVSVAALLAGAPLLSVSLPARAAGVPQTITHQGRLYDASDKPIATTLPVKFTLYADAGGATEVWSETDTISFDEGYFSVTSARPRRSRRGSSTAPCGTWASPSAPIRR